MKITHAIVKEVSENFSSGLTDATLGKPDLARAREQHANYVQALKDCGVQITVLPADDRFPDSTFVEDPAVVLPDCAILTRPGTRERIEETALMRDTLTPLFNTTETIVSPGTLEGGDVLRVDNHVYIGISARTNEKGATQLMEILTRFNVSSSTVPVQHILHLKTGCTYMGDNYMLVAGEFVQDPAFTTFDRIVVPDEEAYAANCLRINDHLIMPKGYPQTRAQLQKLGLPIIELDMSEFEKQDGSLTCLSLRF